MSNSDFRSLPGSMRVYVAVIVAVGFATVVQSVSDIVRHPADWTWTILALLTLVSGSATVRLPSLPATISVSETFVFTSVLLFGPSAGTLTVALDAFVISFWTHKRGDPLYKIVFNISALPLAIWLASHAFFIAAGIRPLATGGEAVSIRQLLLPLLLFTTAYFLLNSWIIAYAIALEKRLSAFRIWRDNFLWLSLNYFGGASVAILLVNYTRDLDFTFLAVIVPLLVVIYFTFSMSMGRVEDANRHLTQLNSLYMSTIETLAMAIDAKDQITHGHIRRVQAYAVALAKEMGVSDPTLIRAVEAAALLHDMGKLAVPEYILNKPGPLTPAEFEKMKLHASVGADILSAIEFPYPVVPIVRHHHENWDGTGYPDRLSGSSIPIGARILSVVDCFDALTSDRPYRPRLADRDAIRILQSRRGSMYDPLVVDTFVRLHPSLVLPVDDLATRPLKVITDATVLAATDRSAPLENINASAGEAVALFALARATSACSDIRELGPAILSHIRRSVPHSCGVLFTYQEQTDELAAAYASGEAGNLVAGLTLPLGQRLSGWVAANRQTIRNSDPILDLGEAAKALDPRPRSCLSTPIATTNKLVGVLTLYASSADFFTEEHQRLVEAAASQVAPAVERVLQLKRDSALPIAATNNSDVGVDAQGRLPENTCLALIDLHPQATESIGRIAAKVRDHVHSADVIFRRGRTQLAVLFENREKSAVRQLMAQSLGQERNLRFVVAAAPQDGRTLEQVLTAADRLLNFPNSADPDRSLIH